MKIVISGSSTFRDKKLEYKKKLTEMGHEVIIHPHYEQPDYVVIEKTEDKRKQGLIKWYYDKIVESDALVVLNFEKNGIANYIGGNTFLEIGFAHVTGKKVFLLNPIPEVKYKDEIEAMADVILNEDLFLIK